jgi:YbbR domain-containing protein
MDFITPDRLNLVVDRRVRLRLPVEPTFIGTLPDGYFLYGAEVRPKKLVVEGPEKDLKALESLATTPIRLDDLTRPVNMRAEAVTQGPYIRIADAEPLQVRVIVDATPIERHFPGLPVQVLGLEQPFEASPATVDVTLAGPPYLIEALLAERLLAVADATGLAAGTDHEVAVRIEYLDVPVEERTRIKANVITPKTIDVRITEKDSKE